jgi:hypothetical protein
MRDILLAAIGIAAGAIMTALALRYATSALLADALLWGGITIAICSLATLLLHYSSQKYGRPFLEPALLLNLAICLVIFGLVWHFSSEVKDDDKYMFFHVEAQSNNQTDFLIRLVNRAPGPFYSVDYWFCPWSSGGSNDPAYWSIGRPLKIFFPTLQNGDFTLGKTIPIGDYRIEFDGTYQDLSYHFVEHLEIKASGGVLSQAIEVRRWISGKDEKLVYSAR